MHSNYMLSCSPSPQNYDSMPTHLYQMFNCYLNNRNHLIFLNETLSPDPRKSRLLEPSHWLLFISACLFSFNVRKLFKMSFLKVTYTIYMLSV